VLLGVEIEKWLDATETIIRGVTDCSLPRRAAAGVALLDGSGTAGRRHHPKHDPPYGHG
jgi:hypothetical protein